ncbi:single-stranded DNA-binding protein, partial [Achromobacter xylosoxidans]
QRPAPQQRPAPAAAPASSGANLADMDDDIPF